MSGRMASRPPLQRGNSEVHPPPAKRDYTLHNEAYPEQAGQDDPSQTKLSEWCCTSRHGASLGQWIVPMKDQDRQRLRIKPSSGGL
jgi:hypothetical protein